MQYYPLFHYFSYLYANLICYPGTDDGSTISIYADFSEEEHYLDDMHLELKQDREGRLMLLR